MPKVILKQKAINDLNSIWDYTFEKWSENQADIYITEQLRLLAKKLVKNLILEKYIQV